MHGHVEGKRLLSQAGQLAGPERHFCGGDCRLTILLVLLTCTRG
jgi:hypothetical protein